SASSSVVLPAPLPPTTATSSHACTVNETPCSTCLPPLTVCQRSLAAISTPRASRPALPAVLTAGSAFILSRRKSGGNEVDASLQSPIAAAQRLRGGVRGCQAVIRL